MLVLIWVIFIKKLFFYIILIGINYAFIELIAYGFFRAKYGEYDRHELQLERIQTINKINSGSVFTGTDTAEKTDAVLVKEVLHPYAGFTVDGKIEDKNCTEQEGQSAYQCFSRIRHPNDFNLPKRQAGVLNVALLGGSVAVATVNGVPKNYYHKKLKELPEYNGLEVNLHLLAAGGYRQPQPLMLLNYYYTLGAEYDLVISLDGFNELAIAAAEYKNSELHPSYPRSWNHRVSYRIDPELINLQAEKVANQQAHLKRATRMSNPLFRNSPTSNLIWKLTHQNFLVADSQLNQKIANLQSQEEKPRDYLYEKLGPDYEFKDWDSLLTDAAQIWSRSNHLAHGMAEIHGAKFFHFIQPNQYIEGAKPKMNDREKKIAIVPSNAGGGYGAWYKRAYPLVKQQQQWMQDQGIVSTDLTFLYKDESRPIFIDNCCHVNRRGSMMIIDKIVDTIHQYNLTQQNKKSASE